MRVPKFVFVAKVQNTNETYFDTEDLKNRQSYKKKKWKLYVT